MRGSGESTKPPTTPTTSLSEAREALAEVYAELRAFFA
jgi:hypothetical protein